MAIGDGGQRAGDLTLKAPSFYSGLKDRRQQQQLEDDDEEEENDGGGIEW